MKPERWRRVQELFAEAVALEAAARHAFLESACNGDKEILDEVLSLLKADGTPRSLIAEPLIHLVSDSPSQPVDVRGHRVGPYELVEEIGRGGLGVVFLAQRLEFEQRVALKVIKRGMDTDEVIHRFRLERQILAGLEHPHIARLLDGGSTSDGLPYFVMELVDGDRLDRYVESVRPPQRRALLRTFFQICSAVEYAHRKLVVHRDLKPSNVLVTSEGPKLLDFGIAKLLTPRNDGDPLTRAGAVPMTRDYASPEQVRGSPVSTASDVYSLGVMLHQMLTGQLPESGSDGQRAASLKKLDKDLKCIVRKCLRTEPEARYSSVGRLSEDIQRHLDGRPVLAREGAWLYRAGRFLRRNRWSLMAAAVVLAAISAGVILQLQSKARIAEADLFKRLSDARSKEAHEQAAIRSDLLLNLFSPTDLDRQQSFTLEALLERGEDRIRSNLDGEPLATQLEIMGLLYGDLGSPNESKRLLEDALRIRTRIYSDDHPLKARILNNLAAWHYDRGAYEDAESLYEQALDMRTRLGQDDVDLVTPLSNLGSILMGRGEYEKAEARYQLALQIRIAEFGEDDPSVATTLRSLGTLMYLRGDEDAAEPLRRALDIRRHHFGERDLRVAAAQSSLGRALQSRGEYEDAAALFAATMTMRKAILGEEHPHVAITMTDQASLLIASWNRAQRTEQLDQATDLLHKSLKILQAHKGPKAWEIAHAESLWGDLLMKRGEYAAAEPFLSGSYNTLRAQRGANAIYTVEARKRLDELRRYMDAGSSRDQKRHR